MGKSFHPRMWWRATPDPSSSDEREPVEPTKKFQVSNFLQLLRNGSNPSRATKQKIAKGLCYMPSFSYKSTRCEVYDPVSRKWLLYLEWKSDRRYASAFSYGNHVFILPEGMLKINGIPWIRVDGVNQGNYPNDPASISEYMEYTYQVAQPQLCLS